ncbi:GPN-loop GTPase 3 [Camellia lanceoleosa]|uniref:GPN-loop GTPase 3 n=1 Tax=Camellia lanceoleosa TaxID=1840588 RepID=A0ACC0IU67_9ERIC|nr:GPN-loop GTPase 3 [Camellia lanceoleosa]
MVGGKGDGPKCLDIRELISLDDVTEELGLGPNGGLLYCMEYPLHLGQIELFSHVPVLKNFVEHLKRKNFNVCAVHLLDSQFMTDVTKFISGCMASLSAMVQLELPHVNILSKMDLVTNKRDIEDYLNPESHVLLSELKYICWFPACLCHLTNNSLFSSFPLTVYNTSYHKLTTAFSMEKMQM